MENVLQTGRAQGMYKLRDHLMRLAEQGIIEQEVVGKLGKEK